MRVKRIIVNEAQSRKLSYAFEEFQVRNKVRNLSIASIKGYRETLDRFAATSANDLKCDDIGKKR